MFNSAGTRGKSWGRIIKINRFELLTNRKRAVTFLHVQKLEFIASLPSTFFSFTPCPTEHVIMALKLLRWMVRRQDSYKEQWQT